MERIIYDDGIDDALEIIESRIEHYDCLIRFDKVDIVELEILEELELLRNRIIKLKYYQIKMEE